jgi:hypothetical protein
VFDFFRKAQLWEAMGTEWYSELKGTAPFNLALIQDAAIYSLIEASRMSNIAEIGGGNSRILPRIAQTNNCYNINKFEGFADGPRLEVVMPSVKNVKAYDGEFSQLLDENFFDILFSVSVIEHVADDGLSAFFADCIRLLRPGGIMVHAIGVYIPDVPSPSVANRFNLYRHALTDNRLIEPLGPVYNGPMQFSCSMATNPDNVMYEWGRISSSMDKYRRSAQSVSLIWGARKI